MVLAAYGVMKGGYPAGGCRYESIWIGDSQPSTCALGARNHIQRPRAGGLWFAHHCWSPCPVKAREWHLKVFLGGLCVRHKQNCEEMADFQLGVWEAINNLDQEITTRDRAINTPDWGPK